LERNYLKTRGPRVLLMERTREMGQNKKGGNHYGGKRECGTGKQKNRDRRPVKKGGQEPLLSRTASKKKRKKRTAGRSKKRETQRNLLRKSRERNLDIEKRKKARRTEKKCR